MTLPQNPGSSTHTTTKIRLERLRELIRSEAAACDSAEEAMMQALEQLADLCVEQPAPWSVDLVRQVSLLLARVARANSESSGKAYECMRLQDHEIAHYRRQLGLTHEHLFD